MISLALPSLLTQGLYSSLVTGISSMTFGVIGSIKSIYNHKNPNLTNHLRRLDIEYHLRLISAVLKNQSQTSTSFSKEHIDGKSMIFITAKDKKTSVDPIQISLAYISKIIDDIHQNLILINQKVEYHQSKWFNAYRILDLNSLLTQLEINTNILKARFDDFIKICTIYQAKSNTI